VILALDTTTRTGGCAVLRDGDVLAEVPGDAARTHAERLPGDLMVVLDVAGLALPDVDVFAVATGPGSFTGLRVGIATAKAMALALRVPMIGLTSLDLLAYPFRHSHREIVAVIDAKRGEVFTARYRHVPGGMQRMTDYEVVAPEDLAGDLAVRSDVDLLVGDGATRYEELFGGNDHVELGPPGMASPTAVALVELAHPRALREEFVQPAEIQPMYLRKADAQINWSMRETA